MKQDKAGSYDKGYHYEEFTNSGVLKYGMWDLPGSPEFRGLWPTFYRYVKMSAVIFLVDAAEVQETPEYVKRIEEARYLITQMLAEDELRNAAFVVIINDKKYKQFQKEHKDILPPDYTGYDKEKGLLGKMLGLEEIANQEQNKRRFLTFTLDVAEIEGEKADEWQDVLEEIKKILIAFA